MLLSRNVLFGRNRHSMPNVQQRDLRCGWRQDLVFSGVSQRPISQRWFVHRLCCRDICCRGIFCRLHPMQHGKVQRIRQGHGVVNVLIVPCWDIRRRDGGFSVYKLSSWLFQHRCWGLGVDCVCGFVQCRAVQKRGGVCFVHSWDLQQPGGCIGLEHMHTMRNWKIQP